MSGCFFPGGRSYSYYWNPENILSIGREALETNNEYRWTDVLTGHALCQYGDEKGMNSIRKTLASVPELTLDGPNLVKHQWLSKPGYIGFFTYYHETYEASFKTPAGKTVLETVIGCHFGLSEEDPSLVGLPVSKYSIRTCSIASIRDHVGTPPDNGGVCDDLLRK
ncbi:MAG: hypothetical protein HY459_03225 [Parcubacteria group bacterium]|nr:hypothetical protein [Parcubacteria group bacterium]